jgi:hypothetical protein
MRTRWILSQFYRNSVNMLVPVAPGYGANWFCPTNPATEDGWALVLISIDPHTIEAAAGDVRLVACRGGCLHSVGRNGGNKYGRSAGQACGERTDLRITEPLTRTAIDLINSIFSRPQSGVAANARCITRPQLELLRRLIGEDEEGGAMQSHYAEPG